jgi:hypothetical protein
MAPKKNSGGDGSGAGRVKFKYMEIEMEGENQALADGLKALANAISRGNATLPLGRPAPALKPGVAADKPEDEELVHPDEQDEAAIEEQDEEQVSGNGNGSGPKKKVIAKPPTFLNNLDLSTASVKLQDFVAQKNPEELWDKYIVFAYWLKEYMKIEEITMDHIFTAFKAMGWQSQLTANPSQTLRDIKSM